MKKPENSIADRYRHFKGGICEVIGVAKHSETFEEFVAYHHAEDTNLWVRPKAMFLKRLR